MKLNEILQKAGITGAGGAGFPSYAKLRDGIDTLLVNAAECEPLLHTDYTILKRERETVLSGIAALLATGIARALLLVKRHNAKALGLGDGDELAAGVRVKLLPDVYPIGDEVSLIHEATGRVMKPGCLPASLGVIVYNLETVYNIGRAVTEGAAVTQKWLTVGGSVREPAVIRVPIGAPVAEVFSKLGIVVPDEYLVIDGGPSMGKPVDPDVAVVTKTTKGLLVLPTGIQATDSKLINVQMSLSRAETACCQCTRCTDMCPRALLGYPLEPHKMVRTSMSAAERSPELVIAATLCCSCGICETVACSQGISPKAVIANYKALLAKNKLRYIASEEPRPEREREYRMLPTERWKNALGVKRFDRGASYLGELTGFSRVEIALRSNIGIAAIPLVKDGDQVAAGAKIAEAANGLSLAQHASIDGTVTLKSEKIIIKSKQ